jgi:hypothetical protein
MRISTLSRSVHKREAMRRDALVKKGISFSSMRINYKKQMRAPASPMAEHLGCLNIILSLTKCLA